MVGPSKPGVAAASAGGPTERARAAVATAALGVKRARVQNPRVDVAVAVVRAVVLDRPATRRLAGESTQGAEQDLLAVRGNEVFLDVEPQRRRAEGNRVNVGLVGVAERDRIARLHHELVGEERSDLRTGSVVPHPDQNRQFGGRLRAVQLLHVAKCAVQLVVSHLLLRSGTGTCPAA